MKLLLMGFVGLFKGSIKSILLSILHRQKNTILVYINEQIDIPKLDEKEEAKIYLSIYNLLIMVVNKFL